MNRLLLVGGLAIASWLAQTQGECQTGKKSSQDQPAAKKEAEKGHKHAYLGLGVESLPEALRSQLPDQLGKGQGILVAEVAKDSPAEKAGLKPFDILLAYGEHKLYSPEQLVKLVRHDTPGQTAVIGYLRGGREASCKATLAEHELAVTERPRIMRLAPDQHLQEMFEEFEFNKDHAAWEKLDAVKLTRLDSKRWRAEVDYRTKDDKQQHKVFEGSREEIRKAIENQKDLPDSEQTHLLRALSLHRPVLEFHFPHGVRSRERP